MEVESLNLSLNSSADRLQAGGKKILLELWQESFRRGAEERKRK